MSWKERMHPKNSRAEDTIFMDLSSDGLTEGLISSYKVDLTDAVPQCEMSYRAREKGKFEFIIDLAWPSRLKALHVDGDMVHKGQQLDMDKIVDDALAKLGWDGKRVRYHAPLSKKRRGEIREEVGEWLKT